MRRTLKQIALDLDVSTMTVSRALRGDTGVGEEMRQRIRRYAQQVNYQPNLIARSLVARRTLILGMIIPNLRDIFWSDMVIAVQQTVRRDGYHVLLTHSEDSGEREREEIETLVSRRVDALLVASCAEDCNAPVLERVEKSGIPLFVVRPLYR